jgi:hypothetical protein
MSMDFNPAHGDAGDMVAARHIDQREPGCGTLRHGEGTAGMKVATRRGIEGAGYLAGEANLLLHLIGMGWQGGGTQGR